MTMRGARPWDAQFRVTGPVTMGQSVPAEVLVRAIDGLQQSVWLLAASTQSRTVRVRFKPDQSFRQRYTLLLSAAEPGSYVVPLTVVDARAGLGLECPESSHLLDMFAKVWHAVSMDDLPQAHTVVGDEGYFLRLMQEFKRFLPKRGDQWALGFGTARTAYVELSTSHRNIVSRWMESPEEQREMTVIGELLRIDFAQKRLWILYPPTLREIECSYRDEVEDGIVEARRGLFQVTGQFVLDADGHPKQLMDVHAIEPVDLCPIQLSEADVAGVTLELDPPLVLQPELEPEEQQFFVAEVSDFGLTLGGRTRDELLKDWADQMHFIWREYALAPKDELSEGALELREKLLRRVKRRARA